MTQSRKEGTHGELLGFCLMDLGTGEVETARNREMLGQTPCFETSTSNNKTGDGIWS